MRMHRRCRRLIGFLLAVVRQRRLGATFLASADAPQPRLGPVVLWGYLVIPEAPASDG